MALPPVTTHPDNDTNDTNDNINNANNTPQSKAEYRDSQYWAFVDDSMVQERKLCLKLYQDPVIRTLTWNKYSHILSLECEYDADVPLPAGLWLGLLQMTCFHTRLKQSTSMSLHLRTHMLQRTPGRSSGRQAPSGSK